MRFDTRLFKLGRRLTDRQVSASRRDRQESIPWLNLVSCVTVYC
jgi:hypothetical protein